MKKYTNNSKFIVFVLLLTTTFTLGQVQGAILLQTGQYIFHGDESNALLGYAVSGVGDVNNDGFDDYIMSAPGHNYDGLIQNGVVYLFFGEEDKNMMDLTLEDADAVFYGEGEGDNAGTSLSKQVYSLSCISLYSQIRGHRLRSRSVNSRSFNSAFSNFR